MAAPRFSIVIPTRERANYLDYALRACLAQRFTDFEVVVVDNCSSPATREVVARYPDERIRYLRSDEPLAMSENWERGVREARGSYVTVLGDDDGLLLHALGDADELIRATGTLALRWSLVHYRWPDVSSELGRNLLVVPLQQGSRWVEAASLVPDVVAGRQHYAQLPILYSSFISNEVLAGLRRRTGRVFHSLTPDIYSGFAIAAEVGRFVSVDRPLAIAGVSARSNGEAMMRQEKRSVVAQDFENLNARFGFRWHPRAPDVLRSLPAIIVECFEQTREHFPALNSIAIDRKALVQRIVSERAQSGTRDADALDDAIRGVRAWVSDDPELARWFEANIQQLAASPPPPHETFRLPALGMNGGTLILDAADFGVGDTLAVAAFFEKLTRALSTPTSPPNDRRSWKDAVRRVMPPVVLDGLRPLIAKLRAR